MRAVIATTGAFVLTCAPFGANAAQLSFAPNRKFWLFNAKHPLNQVLNFEEFDASMNCTSGVYVNCILW